MRTSYEVEFTNLTKHSTELSDVMIINDVCCARLKPHYIVKMELHDTYVRGDYNTIRISVINKDNGVVDKLDVIIADLLVSKPYEYQYYFKYKEHTLFTNTNEHFITAADYKAIAEKIDEYLKLFSKS